MCTSKAVIIPMLFATILALTSIMPSQAGVNVFTDHQVVYMAQHGVNKNADLEFPTGNYPYLGRVGLEYESGNWSYQIAYIHRSNVDIQKGNEYNYNGLSLGVKLTHCIARC